MGDQYKNLNKERNYCSSHQFRGAEDSHLVPNARNQLYMCFLLTSLDSAKTDYHLCCIATVSLSWRTFCLFVLFVFLRLVSQKTGFDATQNSSILISSSPLANRLKDFPSVTFDITTLCFLLERQYRLRENVDKSQCWPDAKGCSIRHA